MSVRLQRKNGELTGKWVVDVTLGRRADGSKDRRTRVVETEDEALALESLLMYEAGFPSAPMAGEATDRTLFRDFVEFVFWPMKQGLADNTKRGYRRDIKNYLIPAFGGIPIGDVNSYRIQRMINGCSSRKVAMNAVQTLSSVLSCACGLRILDFNPANFRASGIRYTYPPPSARAGTQYGEVISDFDAQYALLSALKAECPGSLRERIIVLGLCFGLRPEEVPALDWERVDFDRGGIWIVQAASAVGGNHLIETKNKKKRFVPMSAWARGRLESWSRCNMAVEDLAGEKAHPVVFTKMSTRSSLQNCQHHVARIRGELRYRDGGHPPAFTMESLRHSFATAAIRDGVPVQTVSRWLGHNDVSTTMNRYCKATPDDMIEDMGIVDLALSRAAARAGGADGAPPGASGAAGPRRGEDVVADVKRLMLDFAVQLEAMRPSQSGSIEAVVNDYARAVVAVSKTHDYRYSL